MVIHMCGQDNNQWPAQISGVPAYLQRYCNKSKHHMLLTFVCYFGKHSSSLPYGCHSHILLHRLIFEQNILTKCQVLNSSTTSTSCGSEIGQVLDTDFQYLNHKYPVRVAMAREKSLENEIFIRSGKSRGILVLVREIGKN